MKLPWVSRAHLEAAEARARVAEESVVWYRSQVESLQEQLTRVVRARNGLTERPAPERPKREPMPRELREFLTEFDDELTRQDLRERAERLHRADGVGWDVILATLKRDYGLTGE